MRMLNTIPYEMTHRGSNRAHELAEKVRKSLRSRFATRHLIEVLVDKNSSDFYVVGGTVRRALLNAQGFGDLDLMVRNDDSRVFDTLDSLGIKFEVNRHNIRRYDWPGLKVDVFQPREFYAGFLSVEEALCYFDLRIDSLAVQFNSDKILDPFRVLADEAPRNPGINWGRWHDMGSFDLVVLAIRLARIMEENPQLTLSWPDVEHLRAWLVPQLRCFDWKFVHDRFPAGREAFLKRFEALVLGCVGSAPAAV